MHEVVLLRLVCIVKRRDQNVKGVGGSQNFERFLKILGLLFSFRCIKEKVGKMKTAQKIHLFFEFVVICGIACRLNTGTDKRFMEILVARSVVDIGLKGRSR